MFIHTEMYTSACWTTLVTAINKLGGSILQKNFFKGGLRTLGMGWNTYEC